MAESIPIDVLDRAVDILRDDEGVRRYPYDDATGRTVHAPRGNVTIGVGINLEAGLDDQEIDWLERHRIAREWQDFAAGVSTLAHGFVLEAQTRGVQLAMALMAFQLGERALEFHGMISAIREKAWHAAANEALASAWARQTPKRAERVAHLLRAEAVGP